MFSHVSIGASDVARSGRFYDAFLAPLGITRFWTAAEGHVAGWQNDPAAGRLFVGTPFDRQPPSPGNGCMCAFTAPSRAAVHLAYDAALAHGGTDAGPPGPRPHYAPDYYGAYVRDPDGNKLHVVHRGG
jgi:catechol 2,3-dioxygenase-like lactoylglutathione lyase family enzyme